MVPVTEPDFISIHALREEGDIKARKQLIKKLISIHALREEGDLLNSKTWYSPKISIHALREEGDACIRGRFLVAADFYPRPPRGGRRIHARRCSSCCTISIHALREEGDRFFGRPVDKATNISIHALREEGDFNEIHKTNLRYISIHALREEGDVEGNEPKE